MQGLQHALEAIGVSLSDSALLVSACVITLGVGFALGRWFQYVSQQEKYNHSLNHLHQTQQQQRDFLDDQIDQMAHRFIHLASSALSANNQTFAQMAKHQFEQLTQQASSELKLQRHGFENLLTPIKSSLKQTEQQLKEFDHTRISSEAKLEEQIKQLLGSQQSLQQETRNLVNALRRPEVRGQWGELTLKRLVELSGLSRYCDFQEQPTVHTATGLVRPDMIIKLPKGRQVVVDVKTPLDAYLAAIEAQANHERQQFFTKHAANLKQRIIELSRKAYWQQFEQSPEFVLLFIPGDQSLFSALDHKPELLEYSLERNVLMCSPTSLVAILKTIAQGWQQDVLNNNTKQLQASGERLLNRLTTLSQHMDKLGRLINQSAAQFERLSGSFTSSVKPAARQMSELGVGTTGEQNEDPRSA